MKTTAIPRVKFEVTKENIELACKSDSRHCMIADAVAARLPHVRNISVDMMSIRWSDPLKGWRYTYMTPKPAQGALIDFDMGIVPQPFSFETRGGLATPMHMGSGKDRKRAHKVRGHEILKMTDHGSNIQAVARDSIPMWRKGADETVSEIALARRKGDKKHELEIRKADVGRRGRPTIWHPSHNSLREFGFRGFTKGYQKTSSQ
jgi:hypothetical protein